MEANIEYESLSKFIADLSNLLQHDVVTVSNRLLEKGLVTKNVHDSMLTTEGVSGQKNAARLVSCVLDRIKNSSRCFQDFIDVLREDPYFEDIVMKILEVHTLLQSRPAPPTSGESTTPPLLAPHTVGEPSNSVSVVIERLDKQYIEIEQLVFKTIKRQKVPLEDILDWIRFPPVTLRIQFADLVQNQPKLLANVSSIDELFFILSSYWNSFHPDLLGYLIDKLGDENLKTRMKCYVDDLHHFRIQTTLGDFLDKWVGKIPPGYKEFVLELGEEWRNKTVEDFEQFRICLSRLQSFGGGYMSFMKTAKHSSILVLLSLPEHVFPINFRQTVLHTFLKDENIAAVMVDGQCVFNLENLMNSQKLLWKQCTDIGSNIKNISDLLNQPAVDPNIYDENGRSLLSWVCYLGRTDLAEILIDSGARVDLPNDNERANTPLMIASQEGNMATCALLIKRGAVVDYQNKRGGTALYMISQKGHKQMVELLLDSGATVDKPNKDDCFTALRVASAYGHSEVTRVLIARGAAVNYQDKAGCTALLLASSYGHKEVTQLLLQNGAQPNIPNKNTSIPLVVACYQGYEDICQLLIQYGAATNYQQRDGWSPLHFASASRHPSIVELLMKSGAQVDIQTKTGRTALGWAAREGDKKATIILLNAGANPDIQDQKGFTALMLATKRGHKDVVKALVERKANPNITADKTSGWTALHFASEAGHVEISRMLIEGGADVDIKDKNDLTACDIASTNSHPAVCQLLNNYGYKPSHPVPLTPPQLQPTPRYDPVTSLQTFRDILKHGSKLPNTSSKYQASHNTQGEYGDTL